MRSSIQLAGSFSQLVLIAKKSTPVGGASLLLAVNVRKSCSGNNDGYCQGQRPDKQIAKACQPTRCEYEGVESPKIYYGVHVLILHTYLCLAQLLQNSRRL